MSADPQVLAADPQASAFVSANAGSGKTKTLVDRVARLLLHRARPEAILCVTYTKAAAAEMQRRLFQQLGDWAMLDDEDLAAELAKIGEAAGDLSRARTLFAHALEAPGGLKIETLHAFCEKLLRRFPLEAGVSPSFTVMDDAATADVAAEARDTLARLSLAGEPRVSAAYAAMASTLDFQSFEGMFQVFAAKREAIEAYLERVDGRLAEDVFEACGLAEPVAPDALATSAVRPPNLDTALWRDAARVLAQGAARDQACSADMARIAEAAAVGQVDFAEALAVFCTAKGEPAKWVDTAAALKRDPLLHARLQAERDRLIAVADQVKAARVAQASVHALTLAAVYVHAFTEAKRSRGLLDFTDLVARAKALLREREDAAWVLYKLDGGIDHVLLDEAQDTAPEQWDILRALTGEFFVGEGAEGRAARRTVFIVGDEKQSIYSFQGARPERLAAEADRYAALAGGAAHPFARVPLLASWRSTPEVLGFVDAVFEPQAHRNALQPRGDGLDVVELVRHVANRKERGTIDLWDPERETPVEERRAWDEPLDAEASTGAYRRLAERIAAEIARLVERGEVVHERGRARAATYGDVLILVRKRKALFAELLRACKHRGVPVAGADRLVLSEHPVFEDLLALTRVVLFPHDDLNLAAVLRSPLCDVDEDSLYALARGPDGEGRKGALWAELNRRAGERAEWGAALDLIAWIRRQAAEAPFTIYSRLFSRLDGEGRSMRQRFVTRLGSEAADALEEVLAQALAAEGRGVRDLERFADHVARLEITVKREMDAPRAVGEVRIMTAHSAKGLEAPIVFLPETVSGGAPRGSPLLETPEGGFLWCTAKTGDCEASGRVRALREAREAQETLRLLYVALTRARDRLVIAGRVNAKADLDKVKGWWGPVARAFDHPSLAGQVRDLEIGGRRVRRFGPDPVVMLRGAPTLARDHGSPAWLTRFAPREAEAAYAAPSAAGPQTRGPPPSPLSEHFGLGRFRRGEIIHRLLQVLPDLEPAAWDASAEHLLDKERDLDPAQRTEMAQAALGVLRDARFADVFGPNSRAEASVAGTSPDLPDGYRISGRVDRLSVFPDRVLVADFKTNRPSPDRIEDADPAYITQIAIYAAVLRAVFPGRRVEAALVWTDGPKLTPVPEAMMQAALQSLHTGGVKA